MGIPGGNQEEQKYSEIKEHATVLSIAPDFKRNIA